MTKSDLIIAVAQANTLSKAKAEALVNGVFDSIQGALLRGERVEVRALGSFQVRQYGSYTRRNPRTGTAVMVQPKRLPTFRAAHELRHLLNTSVSRTQELPAVGDLDSQVERKSRLGRA